MIHRRNFFIAFSGGIHKKRYVIIGLEEFIMDLKNVIYEKDGAIATIKLNRPKQLNALSTEVLLDVEAALNEVEADDEVRVVIVTGEGRAFAAGADIAAMKDYDQLAGFDYCATGHKVYRHMEKINKPFIAAVNGYALGGGCEMTLACDLRIASSKAVFGLPETSPSAGSPLTPQRTLQQNILQNYFRRVNTFFRRKTIIFRAFEGFGATLKARDRFR